MNHFFWFLTERIKWLTLLYFALKSMSVRVVLDFLNQASGSPDPSETQSFSWKPFSSISWERDVSPLTTKTTSVLSGFPDRSRVGFWIGWAGWENVSCWTSPQDCRTSLPSGCWSTVEPSGTFPLVQSWSCRNEIFGGGRGDMYDFTFETSPVFNLTTFGSCFLVSLHPDHIYPSGAFSSSRVNCVKLVQGSDKSREPSMFQ